MALSKREEAFRVLWGQHEEIARRLGDLERRLGYQFESKVWLYESLIHRSALGDTALAGLDLPCNERLEFLGDAVLGLIISDRLMRCEGNLDEGELSRLRAGLVNEETLATLARELGLSRFLVGGKGERRNKTLHQDSILADAVEAIIGAVFCDGGIEAARVVVFTLYGKRLDGREPLVAQADFKTLLQEFTQDQYRLTPSYSVMTTSGPDHAKVFEVVVALEGKEVGRGRGASKKRASQAAAKGALDKLCRDSRKHEGR